MGHLFVVHTKPWIKWLLWNFDRNSNFCKSVISNVPKLSYRVSQKHVVRPLRPNKNDQTWISVIFTGHFVFLSFLRHFSASRLKIHQKKKLQPPDKTFPFLLMAFVLQPCDPSGAGCHVSDCPVWEPAQPNGAALQRKEKGRNYFTLST